jgi:hypothetical protein
LEALELGEAAVIETVEGSEAALDAVKAVLDSGIDVDEAISFVVVVTLDFAEVFELAVPVLRFEEAHAAEEPVGVDERVHDGALAGTDRAAGVEILAGEGV